MARETYDPFLGRHLEHDPEMPGWRPLTRPAEPERGTVNEAARRERFVLDNPGMRYTPGAAEGYEKAEKKAPVIKP
jgi:hypothetical protein